MAVVLDPVPSTFDVPLTVEPADDPVLAVLRHARDRVRARHAVNFYIARNGAVCAVGGCWREDVGFGEFDRAAHVKGHFDCSSMVRRPEQWLKDTTVEAIKSLDAVARDLYPELMGSETPLDEPTWIGARVEDVNQAEPESKAKQRVLHCYDVAIERQKAGAR